MNVNLDDVTVALVIEDTLGLDKQQIIEYGAKTIEQFSIDLGVIAAIFGPKSAYATLLESAKFMSDNPDRFNRIADTCRNAYELHRYLKNTGDIVWET